VANITDAIVVLRILKLLTTPIEKSDAYKYGIIDKNGKKIKNPESSSEREAYTILNRFVFKLQYALMKSPDRGAKRLLSLAAAMAILREHNEEDLDSMTDKEIESKLALYEMFDDVKQQSTLLEHNLVSFKTFREEVAANAAGGGGIDGIGIGPKGEPGRDPVMMPMIRRRGKKKNAS